MQYNDSHAADPNLAERKNQDIKEHKTHFALTTVVPVEKVYAFWKNFENFPLFMKEVESIEQISPTRSHWKLNLRPGVKVEWDAEITEDAPNELIAWTSDRTDGEVRFLPAPGGRGTVIEVVLDYKVAGGALTALAAKIWGESPTDVVRKNLHRFRAYIETGEVPTTDGQPSGREEDSTEITSH